MWNSLSKTFRTFTAITIASVMVN